MKHSLRYLFLCAFAATVLLAPDFARAFCGFYVAKADSKLFNKASQVALVRDGNRTVITMSNDFQGDPQEFAIVIPTPTFLEREQIHVADRALMEHLDAYTAPRLVEYFDEDPCRRRDYLYKESASSLPSSVEDSDVVGRAKSFGVTIEAQYTVGEYDILILSAKQSDGLETWLRQENYRIPDGASEVLGSYIRQGTKFFVAKVNLKEQAKLGFSYLRPIQIAFESPKFMLPIRLGTVNADGAQELFVYALTRKGRVETTNYRTVKLATGNQIPVFVKDDFGDFYRDMFAQQVKKEDMRAVFLEYAWDMNWCDPCAADPFSPEELRELGVFWIDEQQGDRGWKANARDVFVTRLHIRYDGAHFPEDLHFQVTGDKSNFQGRYVIRHPWNGDSDCDGARQYREQLIKRQEKEAQTLANLTGWEINYIRGRMELPVPPPDKPKDPWWKRIWKG